MIATIEHGRTRILPDIEAPRELPSPRAALVAPARDYTFAEESGCVVVHTQTGTFVGRFSSRAIAEGSLRFLRGKVS